MTSRRESTEREFAVLFANRCDLTPEEAKNIIAAIRDYYGFTIIGPDEVPMPKEITNSMSPVIVGVDEINEYGTKTARLRYADICTIYQHERAGSQGEAP